MDLDRVAAVIRPRSYPEAIDLGFGMVRAWWRPVALTWAVVGLPLVATLVALLYRHPATALLLLWWLKPLFDRVPLFVFSRGLFGSVPTVAETLRAWPGLARRDLLATLAWRRFDPVRSLRLPVWLLEGQRGRARRRRFGVLAREVRGEATLLTLTCVAFELCLFVGVVTLLLSFGVPREVEAGFTEDAPLDLPLHQRWALVGAWIVAAAFVEPFYVAGGFALYVNRRTHLEAWDIEVVFRRMTSRLAASRAVAATSLAILALLAPLGLSARAAEPQSPDDPAAVAARALPDPRAVIDEVLADPVFGGERTDTYWTLRPAERRRPREGGPALGALIDLVSRSFRGLVVLLAACVSIWILVRVVGRRRDRRTGEESDPEPASPPDEILGLDVRQDSLPEDISGVARELWDGGSRREAVRLLYRGALSRLIAGEAISLKASATEGDCLRLVARSIAASRLDYFRSLTEVWLVVAYAHREPDPAAGPRLIQDWAANFGEPA